jgi:hypothetical protein
MTGGLRLNGKFTIFLRNRIKPDQRLSDRSDSVYRRQHRHRYKQHLKTQSQSFLNQIYQQLFSSGWDRGIGLKDMEGKKHLHPQPFLTAALILIRGGQK